MATKVVHLGDQLESVNTPRARDVEALKLMKHFDEFLGGETNLSPVFNDKWVEIRKLKSSDFSILFMIST